LRQVLALAFHAHLWLLVLAPSGHSSGLGFGPRRAGGTLQLSTRCSSLDLPPSRSLAVRVGSAWIWFACPSARDPDNICATSIIAISRTGARTIVEDNISASGQQQSGHCCRF
jgi:hypothetical protein